MHRRHMALAILALLIFTHLGIASNPGSTANDKTERNITLQTPAATPTKPLAIPNAQKPGQQKTADTAAGRQPARDIKLISLTPTKATSRNIRSRVVVQLQSGKGVPCIKSIDPQSLYEQMPPIINNASFKRVYYLAEYYISKDPDLIDRLDFSRITHLILIRNNVDAQGTIGTSSDFELVIRAAHRHGVSVLLGVTSHDNALNIPLIKSPNEYADFLLTSYVDKFGFDGIDLDFEFQTRIELYEAMPQLVSALRSRLSARGKLLSAAVTYNTNFIPQGIKASMAQFDFVNVMSYDTEILYNIPIYKYRVLETALANWTSTSLAPRSNVIIGIAFHARSGAILKSHRDLTANGKEFYFSAHEAGWLNPTSAEIEKKTYAIKDAGFGGVMVWETSYDSPDSSPSTPSLSDGIERALRYSNQPFRVWLTNTWISPDDSPYMVWKGGSGDPKKEWFGIYRSDTGAYTTIYFQQSSVTGKVALPPYQNALLQTGVPYEIRAYCCNFKADKLLGIFSPFMLAER
jgi:Glycosyl hydrolases family 18